MKQSKFKKWLALTLSLVMLLGIVPVGATGFFETEPNNTRATNATPILTNTPYMGSSSDGNDYDYYTFTLTNQAMVQLSLETTAGTPYYRIALLDSTGSRVEIEWSNNDDSDPNPFMTTRYCLDAGDYYVQICPYNALGGDSVNNEYYVITVLEETDNSGYIREDEDNDDKDSANEIQLDTTYVGNSQYWSDDDYYKLVVTEDVMVQLHFAYEGNAYFYLQCYNESTSLLNFNQTLKTTDADNPWESLRYNFAPGTYYFRVYPVGSDLDQLNDDDYTFSFVTEEPTTAGIRETEFNNTEANADPIQVNTTYVGNLTSISDNDYFTFTLTENQMIQLTFAWPSDWTNYRVTLSDSSGSLVSDVMSADTNPWSSSRHNLPAGTYTIKINYASSNTVNNGDYTFEVIQEEPTTAGIRETEFNDSTATADPIQLGTTYVGNIYNKLKSDYYSFTLDSDQTLKLTLSYQDVANKTIYIRDTSNTSKYSIHLTGRDIANPWTSEDISLEAGSYYLIISNYNYSSSSSDDYDQDYIFNLSTSDNVVDLTEDTTEEEATEEDTTEDTTEDTAEDSDVFVPEENPTEPSEGTSDWAQEEVDTSLALGFVPAELQSDYQSDITRAQFCKLIVQMLMAKSGTLNYQSVFVNYFNVDLSDDPFTDTDDQYVEIAYALQIVNGTGDGLFSPDSSITRQEAATMLARAASVYQFTSYSNDPTVFTDAGTISAWASSSVDFVSANGIMGGMGDGTFSPHGSYTREQSILTALRLYDAFPRDSYSIY